MNQIVTFETSQLLKKLDDKFMCDNVFIANDPKRPWPLDSISDFVLTGGLFPAPTQTELQRLLRENYNTDVLVLKRHSTQQLGYAYICKYEFQHVIYTTDQQYRTYEHALETGLRIVLSLLSDSPNVPVIETFAWCDNSVIDFVNWYVNLHKLPIIYALENQTILESFKRGDNPSDWETIIFTKK